MSTSMLGASDFPKCLLQFLERRTSGVWHLGNMSHYSRSIWDRDWGVEVLIQLIHLSLTACPRLSPQQHLLTKPLRPALEFLGNKAVERAVLPLPPTLFRNPLMSLITVEASSASSSFIILFYSSSYFWAFMSLRPNCNCRSLSTLPNLMPYSRCAKFCYSSQAWTAFWSAQSSLAWFFCSPGGPSFPLYSSMFMNNPSRPNEFLFPSSRWIQLIVAFPLSLNYNWTVITR